MNISKPVTLVLAAIAFCPGTVMAADFPPAQPNLDHEIQMCVSRISAQADYKDAARVVHRVVEAEQKNLVEQKFRIDTLVLADDDDVIIRAYNSTCVTMGPLKVVSFRIDSTVSRDFSAAM